MWENNRINMTREKEIQKLIDEEMGIDNYGSLDFQVGVNYGVKYADKTMIEKACEWLKSRISIDIPIETNENGEPFADSYLDIQIERMKLVEELIDDFRRTMSV